MRSKKMPSTLSDSLLHAYLAKALDPARTLEVDEEMQADPELAVRLSLLAGALRTPERPIPTWRVPPPGVTAWQLGLGSTPVLGEDQIRPGDRFRLVLDPAVGSERQVVLLFREKADWSVVYPQEPDDEVTLGELPRAGENIALDVVARGQAGLQRWAVALPNRRANWDAADRWGWLREAIASGEVPIMSMDVDVVERNSE